MVKMTYEKVTQELEKTREKIRQLTAKEKKLAETKQQMDPRRR